MKPKLKPINEQVVVLLGATSGIGLETAMHLVEKGAKVAIVGRNHEGLNDALEQVRSHGVASRMATRPGSNGQTLERQMGMGVSEVTAQETGTIVSEFVREMEEQVIGFEADVTKFDQVKAVADQVAQRFGGFDTWVNLAGVSEWALFVDTAPEEFQRVIEVNLLGQAYGAMAAIPFLQKQGAGALIFVASMDGRVPTPYHSAYNASKQGIIGLAETIHQEMEHTGVPVSVTTILPASINTPMFEKARSKMGVEPEPLRPVYDAKMVAQAIAHAADHPARELIVGDSGYMMTFMRRLAPTLTNNFIGAAGFRQQRSYEPKPTQSPDNLYDHISGYSHTQGDYPVMQFSLLTWFSTRPKARWVLFGGLLAAVAALVGWRLINYQNQRSTWEYRLPRQARKATSQVGRFTESALGSVGSRMDTLPWFASRRSIIPQQVNARMLALWAGLAALGRRNGSQQVTKQVADRLAEVYASLPWTQKRQMARMNRQLERARRRADRAINKLEERRMDAIKTIQELPTKVNLKEMGQKAQVVERRQATVEKLPFGERKEVIHEKIPYNKLTE